MCNQCGTGPNEGKFKSKPGTPERRAEINQMTTDRILQFGQEVMIVPDGDPAFAYSIGMSMYTLPEFVVVGPLNYKVMHYMINKACETARETEIGNGYVFEPDTLLAGYPVRVVAADPERAQMFQAINHFTKITALQLVWPDKQGHFPDEPGYDTRFKQPVYSVAKT